MSQPRVASAPLSDRQQDVLKLIGELLRDRGYAPTVREICQRLGMTAPANVHRHLQVLRERGFLRMDAQTSRSIVLTEQAAVALGLDDAERASGSRTRGKSRAGRVHVARVPLRPPGLIVVGQIAAGVPVDAIENPERFDLATEFDPERHFLLRVKGDSMVEAHITEGDLVVIRQQPTCHDGDVVAAVIDGEATLKRFYRRKGHILLKPANRSMQPLKVKSVEIRGVLVGVIRKV